jgi:hypothetical protein
LLRGSTASAGGRTQHSAINDQPRSPLSVPCICEQRHPSTAYRYRVERRRRARQKTSQSPSQPQSLSRERPRRGVSGRANMRRHVASETLRIPSGRSPAMALLWAQTGISMSDSARAGRSVRRRVDQTAIWRFQVAGSGAGEETQNGCLGCIAQRSDRPALTALSALSLPRGPPRCCRAREGRRPRKYFVQGGNESSKPPSLPEHPCTLSCGDGCRQ